MLRVAVYDKFYLNHDLRDADITGQALAGLDGQYEVFAGADDLRLAVAQVVHLASLPSTKHPDVVIMGGALDGEREYRAHPEAVTEPCTVRRRTLFRNVREEAGKHITFLLPQFSTDGSTYHFPEIVTVGGAPKDPPQELLQQWSAGAHGIAPRVLSRVVETYLPRAVRLGVAGRPMIDVSLSAEAVQRRSSDAAILRGHILRLTGEA